MATTPTTQESRVGEQGQVTLPDELLQKWGMKPGDVIAFEDTEGGILLKPRAALAMAALDRLGEILRENGVTLEEWIESGREIRGQLIEEEYGLKDET